MIEVEHFPIVEGGFVRTFTDITARKRAEEKLQLQNVELRIQNEQLDAFARELERLQQEKLFQLNKAYERFVPREFLKLLDKESVIDVQLGDQVEKEMSIMFCDIRDFTARAEKMKPQAIFDLINNYLSEMEPIISEYGGFIDKYIGDAIMALFPGKPDDAIDAALAMLEALAKYNQKLEAQGRAAIEVGIGVNTGILMLGTLGGKNRMDGTVIADAVNLASRVEGLTKIYGSSLLMTQQTYIKLVKRLKYKIRVIDAVKVKGKSEVVTVYEVFDADDPMTVELKMATRTDLEEGFVLYHSELYADALPPFEKVLRTHPDDRVAQIYFGRCTEYIERSAVLNK